jgi:hypothetical protein
MAKLFVPGGAPLHVSCGERFFPPAPSETYWSPISSPSENDSLVTVSGFPLGDCGARTGTVSYPAAVDGIRFLETESLS